MASKEVKQQKKYKNRSITSRTRKTASSKSGIVSTRIRKIGNSKGVLLSNAVLQRVGIEENQEVVVTTEKDCIIIKPAEGRRKINTDLNTWETQFKAAIKSGDKPEDDIFNGIENYFDKEEW